MQPATKQARDWSVPYFLPVTSALGTLGSSVPDDVYLGHVRLPFAVVRARSATT
jgi:hypothetical protein